MSDDSETQTLLKRTWKALQDFKLDHTDSRNVARYEKLAKLHIQLTKMIAKEQAKQPEEEITLDLL